MSLTITHGTAADGSFSASGATAWDAAHSMLAYDSGAQTITLSAALTLAHGLGIKPKIVEVYLTNVTAEFGFTTGDEIDVSLCDTGTNSRGLTIQRDATNVILIVGVGIPLIRKDTFLAAVVTAANWTIGVRAYA